MVQDHKHLPEVQQPCGFPAADSWQEGSCCFPHAEYHFSLCSSLEMFWGLGPDRQMASFLLSYFALVSSASQLAMMEVGTSLLIVFLIRLDGLKEERG